MTRPIREALITNQSATIPAIGGKKELFNHRLPQMATDDEEYFSPLDLSGEKMSALRGGAWNVLGKGVIISTVGDRWYSGV